MNMKKIILLVFIILPFFLKSQTIQIASDVPVPAADSIFATLSLSDNNDRQYDVQIVVEWYGLTGTLDGRIVVYHSIVDSLKVQYATDVYTDLNTTTGSDSYELWSVTANKIYLKCDVNNLTAGTINAWATYKRITR